MKKALGCFLGLSLLAGGAQARPQLSYEPDGNYPTNEGFFEQVMTRKNWSATLGLGAAIAPKYEGSDRADLSAVPIIDVSYNNRLFFLGTQGVGVTPLRGKKYSVAFGLGYNRGREESDDRDNLRGMGDVKESLLGFIEGTYNFGSVFVGGDVRGGLSGDYGTTFGLKFGAQQKFASGISMKGDIHLRLADEKHMESFFGVDQVQAARSGKRAFSAEGGLKSWGLGIAGAYPFARSWSLRGQVVGDWLTDTAARSPLSVNDFQPSGYLGVAYSF